MVGVEQENATRHSIVESAGRQADPQPRLASSPSPPPTTCHSSWRVPWASSCSSLSPPPSGASPYRSLSSLPGTSRLCSSGSRSSWGRPTSCSARRNPVSSYLRRDVGAWTAIASVLHVILGFQAHSGSGIFSFLDFFVRDGRPLTNRFGLGNWTGLAALVIVVGLLALSTHRSLRELKARATEYSSVEESMR